MFGENKVKSKFKNEALRKIHARNHWEGTWRKEGEKKEKKMMRAPVSKTMGRSLSWVGPSQL